MAGGQREHEPRSCPSKLLDPQVCGKQADEKSFPIANSTNTVVSGVRDSSQLKKENAGKERSELGGKAKYLHAQDTPQHHHSVNSHFFLFKIR